MKRFFLILIILLFAAFARPALAQDAVSLTITPPFFEVALAPGTSWSSSIKVVNTSPAPVPIYASVADLAGSDDEGHSTIKPVTPGDPELGSWIATPKEPITLAPDKEGEVPFSINVPQNAAPGGHYAAILIGTQPFGAQSSGTRMLVSSYISSLIFVRISGNVIENGTVRDFYTEHNFYQTPKLNFLLRFENKGNVHLQPRGVIDIYNMWGREVAEIPINQDTSFGNVLPNSTRKFVIPWSKESSLLDLGRFTAVATITYGAERKQNVSAVTSFYVIPLRPLGIALGIIFGIVLFIYLLVRTYVRRTLAVAGFKPTASLHKTEAQKQSVPMRSERYMQAGMPVLDLRKANQAIPESPMVLKKGNFGFVKKIIWIVLLTAFILLVLQFVLG